MNNDSQTKDIKHMKELFGELKSNDPKIIVTDNIIELNPFYGSFSFLINFLPILGSAYILIVQNNLTVDLLSIFAIIISLSNIFLLIVFYNKIIIDLNNKMIKIIPNFLFRYFKKDRNLHFSEIKKIDYSADSIWLGDRRFKIKFLINNSTELIYVISTSKKEMAYKIISALLSLR